MKDTYYFTSTTKMPAINDLNFWENNKASRRKIFEASKEGSLIHTA